jgi:flagellar biosynthesis/type III secretory pathway ATPase
MVSRRKVSKLKLGFLNESGVGREVGMGGLKEYTETEHVHIGEVGTRGK